MGSNQELNHSFSHVSGTSDKEYCFVVHRFEGESFHFGEGDGWMFQKGENGISAIFASDAQYTGLWVAKGGDYYVADITGHVFRGSGNDYVREEVSGVLSGIWGLSNELVYAWGFDYENSYVHLWNGTSWNDLPGFEGRISQIHGSDKDNIYATTFSGEIYYYDNNQWKRAEHPECESLAGIFVKDTDRVYAYGKQGCLLEKSKGGIFEKKELGDEFNKENFQKMGYFDGSYWISSNVALYVLNDGKLEKKDDVAAISIESRNDLLFCSETDLYGVNAETKGGFKINVDKIKQLTSDYDPMWK